MTALEQKNVVPCKTALFPLHADSPIQLVVSQKTRNKDELFVTCPYCQLYYQLQNAQINNSTKSATLVPNLLSQEGSSTRAPVTSPPGEVRMIGECDGVIFYLSDEDAISQPEVTLMICVPIAACTKNNLHQAGKIVVEDRIELIHRDICTLNDHSKHAKFTTGKLEENIENLIPDDALNQAIYQSSIWIAKQIVLFSEAGAKQVEYHGEQWRCTIIRPVDGILQTEEQKYECDSSLNVHPEVVQQASYIRSFSKTVRNFVEQVSESVSNFLGILIGCCIAEKPTDGETTRYCRHLLRTTVLSCGEISEGVEEGFDIFARAAKREVTSCVAIHYGRDAADVTRHTLGTSINLIKTAITVRRVLNAKKVARSSIKAAASSVNN
jgi:hypothetical protein